MSVDPVGAEAAPIAATYAIAGRAGDAERVARAIAYEQTVELPEALVDAEVTRDGVGRVAEVRACDGGSIVFLYGQAQGQGY